jgi:hypothetical protein
MSQRFALAFRRALPAILAMAAVYATSIAAGMAAVHADLGFALEQRDSIVSRAVREDPVSRAESAGAHGKAALMEFSRNVALVAIPETIGGLTFVLPVGLGAYRGWVGGIVSVNSRHQSRLRNARSATYYVVTVLLQAAGYALADGAGLYLGWAFLKRRGDMVGPRWFRLPREALKDVVLLYALIVPLFALGSLWEFFAGP